MLKHLMILCALLPWLIHCQTSPPVKPIKPVDPKAPITFNVDGQPPWYKDTESIELASAPTFGQPIVLTLGKAVSVHRTQMGLFVIKQGAGVLGKLVLPPDWIWVGLDGQDMLWGATAKGQIYRQSIADALANRWTKTKIIPQSNSWDVSGNMAGVLAGQKVFLSNDLGTTWQQVDVPKDLSAKQLHTRHDGIIALFGMATGKRTTYLSSDMGKTWQRSAFQPQNLKRHGSWIWNADPNCVGVLSRDGKTWSAAPQLTPLPGWKDPRNAMLSIRFKAHKLTKRATHNDLTSPPAVPPKHMTHTGEKPTCQDPIPEAKQLKTRTDDKTRGPQPTPCQGAMCLRVELLPKVPTSAVFYSIVPTMTATDPKQILMVDVDKNTTTVNTLPNTCVPKQIYSLAGMALLLCQRGKETVLMTRTRDRAWKEEVVIAQPVDSFRGVRMSTDGTIALQGRCDNKPSCQRSYVRRPKKATWFMIRAVDAGHVLPVDQGRALSVIISSPGVMSVFLEDGQQAKKLTTIMGTKTRVRDMDLNPEGQLQLHMGDEFKVSKHVVQYNGHIQKP